eukprot:scaffold150993_cov63-Attheya_sp.AAC.2
MSITFAPPSRRVKESEPTIAAKPFLILKKVLLSQFRKHKLTISSHERTDHSFVFRHLRHA